ncbi:KH domain-containing protein [Vulcanisaeta souniana]|uniref:RNA-processing protein n=1 Tax=Vulcanisaeta souniana JCM 11219 TaxID=1293586 RepID=A0A830EC90_9CREN|nr:KH domain-containing protein [Vulcanisaeta souniana]BDR91247.1 RNA-processing protein [Vulcanisaeta souniana JCM 11219]GGI85109.1 RNA-processing protein [Vulcanisaeta souniana JCM 11219]
MISDYMKGGFRITIEKNRLKAISDAARLIEEEFGVRLIIDSDKGEVTIVPGDNTNFDQLMKAKNIIEAISYGFDYNDAQNLRSDDYTLEIIDLRDYVDKDKANHVNRVKARIIGEDGRAKRVLQELTDTNIVIGDKYIAILGFYENVKIAREALEMLIRGRQHATVYKWIQNWRRENKYRELMERLSRSYQEDDESEDEG